MKKLFHSFAVVFLVIICACKKESQAPSVLGYWTGTAVNTVLSTSFPISILYRSNNTARFYLLTTDTLASANIEGTYTIGSDSIRTTYTIGPNTTEYASKQNNPGTQMNGTFRSLTVSTNAGTWSVTKQP